MKAKHYNNTIDQALNYAAADRSDPFTFNRAMSHTASGLCDDAIDKTGRSTDCRYKAESYQETRYTPATPDHPDGQEYSVTCYRNLQRP